MNFLKKTVLLTLPLLLLVTYVNAEEKKWSDEAELSSVNTGGNSNVTTFSAKNILMYKFSEHFEGSWKASALSSKSEGVRSAENYAMELRGDYLFSKRLFGGLAAGWNKNKFSGIDARYYGGPFAGYKFLTGPKHLLRGETGLDYVSEEYTDNTENDFMRGRLFGAYQFLFTEVNKFKQSVEYLHDFDDADNYNINTETALITVLSQNFSLKTSYEIKFDNQPVPSTLKKTDTLLAVALLVNF